MKLNFSGKYYHDITFIPQWITKNVLSDWKEVKEFTIESVEEYSAKSFVVEGKVTYNFENGELHTMKFYVPKNHFNEDKAKEFVVSKIVETGKGEGYVEIVVSAKELAKTHGALSIDDLSKSLDQHNKNNNTNYVIVDSEYFKKLSENYLKFEAYLEKEKIKAEKKAAKANKKDEVKSEIPEGVEEPDFESEDEDGNFEEE